MNKIDILNNQSTQAFPVETNKILQKYLQHIEASLMRYLPTGNSQLEQAMRYSVLNGGKRLRPLLCMATADTFHISRDTISPFACALEFIHAYSLIHDDLPAMDNDKMRRGKPTCHIVFNEATAILAGDALQALAFEIITHSVTIENSTSMYLYALINLLASSCGYNGMAGGQAIDLASAGKTLSLDGLIKMHQLKTGKLIQAAILGSLHYGKDIPKETEKYMDIYANKIGLAFQIKDDILDEVGDANTIGKHTGKDKELEKPTFTSILGLEQSNHLARQFVNEAHDALKHINYNTSLLAFLATYIINRCS